MKFSKLVINIIFLLIKLKGECLFYICHQETGQPFTDCDVSIFEAFAIFCGLGIHNTQMYENACKFVQLI